jgi:thiol-disulfide isomerase/thioredoxin
MKQLFEILIPLALIIVLLMCMMNNNTEEYFSVGGKSCKGGGGVSEGHGFKVGGQCKIEPFKVDGEAHEAHKKGHGFKVGAKEHEAHKKGHHDKKEYFKVGANLPGNSGNSKCDVTMVWANWCGYSNKAKPEYDSLMKKNNGKVIDGCVMNFDHAEEKEKPEIVKKFQTKGFPTYYVSVDGKKHEEFNSIKEDDMLSKIKSIISKHKGGKDGFKIGGQNAPPPNRPAPNRPAPNRPAHNAPKKYAKALNSIRPVMEGEMLYSGCKDSEYGPVRLDSVSRNLTGIGNSPQKVTGYGDCTELEFAPIKMSTGGPQIPSKHSLMPNIGQLPAPHIDGVQGITRPLAFNSPNSVPNSMPNSNSKKARVSMIKAAWCGFCKKAMPEWEKLKGEIHDKVVNGYHVTLRDLEQKKDENEIKENYPHVKGYPTYVVETQGPGGEYQTVGSFNSIEKNDMHEKIKQHLQ